MKNRRGEDFRTKFQNVVLTADNVLIFWKIDNMVELSCDIDQAGKSRSSCSVLCIILHCQHKGSTYYQPHPIPQCVRCAHAICRFPPQRVDNNNNFIYSCTSLNISINMRKNWNRVQILSLEAN